jgi:3alpha(or 20beta)-hydroxysteroid dehydrogenase
MIDLTDKVVLVSGAARGIGAAVARATVAAGGKVVIGDALDADGRKLAAELGGAATYVHLDVTDPATWDIAVATAVERYGRLDALVNNAGIAGLGPIDAYPREAWDRIVAVNLTGVFNGIQAALPALQQAGGGSIVNVSSVAGLQGIPSSPGYVATKFGVRGLTKAAALDLGRYGIRVNSVHPGFVRTPMTAALDPDMSNVALGRGGDPDEIADLIVFVVSDACSFSTGAEFVADGGEMAGDAHGGSLGVSRPATSERPPTPSRAA